MTNQEFIESIRLEGEEWKDVVEYEGLYSVSSFGRIASLNRTVPKNNFGSPVRHIPPRLLNPNIKRDGYRHVILCRDGIHKHVSVHRIVALAFIANANKKPMIDHIDRDRTNNRVENLRWCTISENMHNPLTRKHCSELNRGRQKPYQYKPVVALKEGNLVKQFASIKDAIAEGFTGCQISNVCAGRQAYHKGFKWMYLSDYENLVSMSKNS